MVGGEIIKNKIDCLMHLQRDMLMGKILSNKKWMLSQNKKKKILSNKHCKWLIAASTGFENMLLLTKTWKKQFKTF